MACVYIAGAFPDCARGAGGRARAGVDRVDWTPSAENQYVHGVAPQPRRLADDAQRDLQGVLDADAVLVLVLVLCTLPNYAYRGTMGELGAALAMDKPVVMVDGGGDAASYQQVVFVHHPFIIDMQARWHALTATR